MVIDNSPNIFILKKKINDFFNFKENRKYRFFQINSNGRGEEKEWRNARLPATSLNICPKIAKYVNNILVCKSKLRSVVRSGTCGRISALETGWQSGMWSCIMPGLPTHLVQELNVGTVPLEQQVMI